MASASDNFRGSLLLIAAMACFAANDAIIKLVTERVPLFEVLVLRGLFALPVLVAMGIAAGGLGLRLAPGDRVAVALRTAGEVGATLFFLSALQHLPLGNLSAIIQSLPLVMTLASAVVFREPLGWRRLTAVLVGFVGMLLIVRPGGEGFNGWSLVGILAMLCVVLRDMTTKTISARVSALAITFYASLAVTGLGLVGVPFQGWVAPRPGEVALIAAAAVFINAGFMAIIVVMRISEFSLVAPFRYSQLLWAVLLGWLVFAELPDAMTFLGGTIVVATGIFTLLRERRLARQTAGLD